MKFLEELTRYANETDTDISDHLVTIYLEALKMNPKVIVELGVGNGQSSIAFNCVNKEIGSQLFGIDIEPNARNSYNNLVNSKFILADDCAIVNEYKTMFGPNIDVLMIDSSHYYEHTKDEISKWFPLLSDKSLVIFHDTYISGEEYIRKNGSKDKNWDNNRGVIRSIEEYFNKSFNEKKDFSETNIIKDKSIWRIQHYSGCNGLTLCWKEY
jgi:hypothetical protein